jgi:mRNA-degrading endonuclease RelE of RelBE toxin-antitoxin system
MQVFEIVWTVKAIKQLKRIDSVQQKKIVIAVRKLANWPDCKNVKLLEDFKYQYRLRVGRYRVFFNVETSLKVTRIEEVKKRDERTY